MKLLKTIGLWLVSLGLASFTAHYLDTHGPGPTAMGFVVILYGGVGAFASFMRGVFILAGD